MKEFNKLYNKKQNYIKEKQIIEQELVNNKKIIDDLNIKIKSLKDDDKLMKDFKKDSFPKYNEKLNRLENLKNEYNKKSNGLENLEKEYQNDKKEKIQNIKENKFIIRSKIKGLNSEKIEKKIKHSEFYEYELNISDSRIKYLDKMIEENLRMSAEKIYIINQLKLLYIIRKDYFRTKTYNPEIKKTNLKPLDDQIRKLEDEFRDQKGSGTFIS